MSNAPYVSNEELDEILLHEVERTKYALDKKKMDSLIPRATMYGVENGEKVAIVALIPEMNDKRFEMMHFLGSTLAKEVPDFTLIAVTLSSEVWTNPTLTKEDIDNGWRPRDEMPGREEAISHALLSWDGLNGNVFHEIVRDKDGNISLGDERVDYRYMPSDGEKNMKVKAPLLQEVFDGWTEEREKRLFGTVTPTKKKWKWNHDAG